MRTSKDHIDIEAYLFGELTPSQRAEMEQHLTGCAECREDVASLQELERHLGAIPPEALLDGPPEDADLLLTRTLRQLRTESSAQASRRRALTVGVAAAVAAVLVGLGVVVGQSTSGGQQQIAQPTTSAPAVPGTRNVSNTDPSTGAQLAVAVIPAAGWVRLSATVSGIPAGEPCNVVVVSRDGTRTLAGGWLVSEKGAREGTTLDGSALMAPDQVAAVVVENTSGRQFVTVDL